MAEGDGMHVHNPFKNLSKNQKIAVIVGGSLIGGYALYAHKKSTGSWNPLNSGNASSGQSGGASDSGSVTDPSTGQSYPSSGVDPLTGMTYGQEIAQYGNVENADTAVSGQYGVSAGTANPYSYSTGYNSSLASVGTSTISGSNVYTSNSSWAQAVQAGLTDISGSSSYDGTDIGTALGLYLTGQPLTAAQAQVISTAIAEYGPPPVGNLQIIKTPVAGTGTTTTTPAAVVPKPSSTWSASVGSSTTTNDLNVHWDPVPGASVYEVKFANGWDNAKIPTNGGIFSVASVGKSGTYRVRAGNSAGWAPWSAAKKYTFPNKG